MGNFCFFEQIFYRKQSLGSLECPVHGSVIHLSFWTTGVWSSWIHVIHSGIPSVHWNLIVMLAHPAGDGVTTSITLALFSVSHVYLSIARQFLLFCSATSENSKENKNLDIKRKESMDLCYSKITSGVIILRKVLGKSQIKFKLQSKVSLDF